MSDFLERFRGLGWLAQGLGILSFAFYFPALLCFLAAHILLWGIHSMIFGPTPDSQLAVQSSWIPFLGSIAVGLAAGLGWTAVMLGKLAN
jgi:hypothetical protein